jgi:large subunit ribosomal protein L24
MNKLKAGDQVIVISGKDKGKIGVVKRRIDENRLIVEGVNVVKKSVKPNPAKGEVGGFKSMEASIHQSNVAIYNVATGKADRVGIKLLDGDDRRRRVYKSSGEEIKVA